MTSEPHQHSAVQVFFGTASDTECRVYARLALPAQPDTSLTGSLRGPECRYARTLPATYAFRPLAANAAGVAEAWIPDPCFWNPELPFVYGYQVQTGGPETLARGILGIRRLGTENNNLFWDRKRWVLRAAEADLRVADLPAWHDADLAAVVRCPSDALCEAASQIGVLLVAELPSDTNWQAEIPRLARWPAVGIVLTSSLPAELDLRRLAPNLLWAQRVGAEETAPISPWANLAFCTADDSHAFARRAETCTLPIVATRTGPGSTSAPTRAGCDLLQRELAPLGLNVAGFVVGGEAAPLNPSPEAG